MNTQTDPLHQEDAAAHGAPLHRVSIVIPVYRGETTLPSIVAEIEPLTTQGLTPEGNLFVVSEVVLAHDCGPDRSDKTIEALAQRYPFVAPVWLSRNYGQHAATMAGMASATAQWVVTMDEDGQQDPADIAHLLDAAIAGSCWPSSSMVTTHCAVALAMPAMVAACWP
jgi:glycosyltransferase involved in cell wall biosynthesis